MPHAGVRIAPTPGGLGLVDGDAIACKSWIIAARPCNPRRAALSPMSDSLRKVLLGAVIGALHRRLCLARARGERAKRAPAGRDPHRRTAAARGDAARRRRVQEPSARRRVGRSADSPWSRRRRRASSGCARNRGARHRARQRVDRRDGEGLQPRHGRALRGRPAGAKGNVLVELDGEQARADLAVAQAALKRKPPASTSAAASLYDTQVLSDAQIEQIEATLKRERGTGRVGALRGSTIRSFARRSPGASDCAASASAASSSPAPSSRRSTTRARSSSTSPCRRPSSAAMQPGLRSRRRASPTRSADFAGHVASVDSRVDPEHAIRHRARAAAERRWPAETRHVPDRAARARRGRRAGRARRVAGARAGRRLRLRRRGRQVAKRKIQTGQRRVGTVQVIAGLRARRDGRHRRHAKAARRRARDVGRGRRQPTRAAAATAAAAANEAVRGLGQASGLRRGHQPDAGDPRPAGAPRDCRCASCPTSKRRSSRSRPTTSAPRPTSSRRRSRR